MLKEKRQKQILELLKRDGQVKISTLVKIFQVTEMTIRRDLDQIAEVHDIIRTHGGAMTSDSEDYFVLPYEKRMILNGENKNKIAIKALSMVNEKQSLFFDSGTTTYCMAENISNEHNNTIVTTGLNVAIELLNRQKLSVIIVGGNIRRNTISVNGPMAEEQLSRFKVDYAFLGANGVGEDGSVYIGNVIEYGIKNTIMQNAKEKYLLVDSSKFGDTSLLCYSKLSDFDGVITDSNIDSNLKKKLEEQGVNIIVA